MEEEIYENNYENCDYCETTYYESDISFGKENINGEIFNSRKDKCG